MLRLNPYGWTIGRNFIHGMKALIATAVAASIILCGCEPSRKHLVNGYKLERFQENGLYYVVGADDLSGGGVFEGTVQQIGWNSNWILAAVTKNYHGDTNGWYALDVKARRVTGPIGDVSTNAEWSRIRCVPPENVFRGR